MFKRNISIIILILFIFTLFPSALFQNVHAYTSNFYSNNPKIGLTSMSATSIKISLNGDYTLNGQTYSSGSVLNLGISGTSITLNGLSQSEINLIPNNQSNLLTITSGSTTNKYMGSFLIKVYNANILPINILDMENYLKGVVGYEMSDYFPLEALKAQAVAARNYALSKMGYEASKGYDFDDTINYQVYKGYNASYTNVLTSVDATKGQVLLYNDKLVETLYSAWHGGVSENSENVWGNTAPYLRSVQDTYEHDPWPNGNRVLTSIEIQNILKTKGFLTGTDTFIKLDLISITNFESGRVSNINIVYKNTFELILTKSVALDSTRTFLSLPSNLYTVTYDSINDTYTFFGKGYGHGLGMSQIGAKNRATAGQTYNEILQFYYQNTYLQTLNSSLTNLTQNTSSQFQGGTKYEPVKNLSSTALPKAKLSTITGSGSFYVGKSLALNARSTGASTLGFSYKYEVYKKTTRVGTSNFNKSGTFNFTTTVPGTYTVKVYGKDGLSSKAYDSMKQFSITITSKPLGQNTSPLKFGMKNNNVVSLQKALVKLGYKISDKSGYFGAQTKNQVIAFQKSKKLTKDGIVGSGTYNALNEALIKKSGIKTLTY